MKAEEDIHIPEVVEEDLRNPSVPATLNEIAARKGEAAAIIDARVMVLKTLRIESIRRTSPEDWVAYRDEKTGREIAYLQDSGCQRIAPLWGIETRPKRTERTPEKSASPNEDFAYTVTGDGQCKITNQVIYDIEGTRYSNERYAEQSPAGIHREVAVKKAARANFDGTCVRKLAGMNVVPVAELLEVWGDPKMKDRIAKGRGYGTQDQRVGGAGKEGLDQSDIPMCPVCNIKLVLRAAKGDRGAFWGCKNYEKHPETKVMIDDEKVRKEVAAKKAQPQTEGGK
jgi:hypothetical protein